MVRGVDTDYIGSLSLMDGFDMGINFGEFGENMKKFMELPIKYLDSAHDKAVELVEDIHALICTPFPDDELPNKGHGTLKDPSSNNVITESLPTSVEMELVDPNEEFSSPPTSPSTAEDSFMGSIDTDAHETESFLTKCPDFATEQTNRVQDYVSHEVNTDKVIEQVGLHRSGHSESSACNGALLLEKVSANGEEQSELCSANDPEESTKHGNIMDLSGGTISCDLSADAFSGAGDPSMWSDDIIRFIDIDHQDDQEQMKNQKAEASSVPQPKNTSFKKIFMRSLSSKLRWSKKDMNVHQAVPILSQEAVNATYQAVSSSDGLEDDWELL